MNYIKCLFYCFLIFCTSSCADYHKKDKVKALIGKTVLLDNADNTIGKERILILIPDTLDCAVCAMQIYDWYIYKLDLEKNKLNCDVLYILNDSVKLNETVKVLLKNYHLLHTQTLSKFLRNNEFLNDAPFKTFLIDKSNRILLVGSPLDNSKLWFLYKRIIKEQS